MSSESPSSQGNKLLRLAAPGFWFVVGAVVTILVTQLVEPFVRRTIAKRIYKSRLTVEGMLPVCSERRVENPFDRRTPFYYNGIYLVVGMRATGGAVTVERLVISGVVESDIVEYALSGLAGEVRSGMSVDSLFAQAASARPFDSLCWTAAPWRPKGKLEIAEDEFVCAAFEVNGPMPPYQPRPEVYYPDTCFRGCADGTRTPRVGDPRARPANFLEYLPNRWVPVDVRTEVKTGAVACTLVTSVGRIGIPYSKFKRLRVLVETAWADMDPVDAYYLAVDSL